MYYCIITNNKEIASLAKKSGAQVLQIASENGDTQNPPTKKISIQKDPNEILLSLGIRPKIKGFKYIKYILVSKYNDESRITREIYPDVAKKFHTTPSRVERAIRHAIQSSYFHSKNAEVYTSIFGEMDDVPPTNGEFIFTLKLLLSE